MSMPGRSRRGILFVISGPSGAGKSSLVRRVLAELEAVAFSVSYTTRPPRPGERDGHDYRFVDDDAFDRMLAAGDFLEWARVFGRRYGTGRKETEEALAAGLDLLLDIDVQGARQIREAALDAVAVFVLPPSFQALAGRLRSRASESEEDLSVRLSLARREAEEYPRYDYLIVNDDLERATRDLRAVIEAERRRVRRLEEEARRILETFGSP
jgi:guanylate kinase